MNDQENTQGEETPGMLREPTPQPDRAEAEDLVVKLLEARIAIKALRESFSDDLEKNKELKIQYDATRDDTDIISIKLRVLGYTEYKGVLSCLFA